MARFLNRSTQAPQCNRWTLQCLITPSIAACLSIRFTMVLQVSRIPLLIPSSNWINSYQAPWDFQLNKIRLQLHLTISSSTFSMPPQHSIATTSSVLMKGLSKATKCWQLVSAWWWTNRRTRLLWWALRVRFIWWTAAMEEAMAPLTLRTIEISIVGGSFR